MKRQCKRCKIDGESDDKNMRFSNLIHEWLCKDCATSFDYKFVALRQKFLRNESPKPLDHESFFPPPWNFIDEPKKTEGWIEFQKYMKKHPEYYLESVPD